jgi:VWFA-related protein
MKFPVLLTTLELVMLPMLAAAALAQGANTPQDRKQDQDQTIRVATTLIEVRAVVTDKQGRPITGLTASDFELLENKQTQEINFFSVVTVGGATSAPSAPSRAVEKPAAPSSRPSPAVSPARSVVLFVDNIHLKDSNLAFARKALKKFIAEQLTDDDLTALVTSGGSLGLFSQFTRDRRILGYAVDKISLRGPNRNTMFTAYLAGQVERDDREAIALGIDILRVEDGITGPVQMMENLVRSRARQVLAEASYQRQVALASLKALTDSLAKLPGTGIRRDYN